MSAVPDADTAQRETPVRRGLTIRGRLALLVAIALAPLALFAPYYGYEERTRSVARALDEAEVHAARVVQRLNAHVHLLQALAAAAEAAVADDLGDRARVEARLRRMLPEVSASVASIVVFAPDGGRIAGALGDAPGLSGVNIANLEHFRTALRTRAFAIGAPVTGRGPFASEWLVPVARPMLDSRGEVRAVIAIPTLVRSLDAMLEAQRPDPDSVVALASSKGILIARSPAMPEARGKDQSGMPHFRVARSGGTFKGEVVTMDGVRRFGVSVPVPNAPWQVFVGTPVAKALAPADAEILRLGALATAMLLAAALAAWWLARGLALPILRLRRGVNAFALTGRVEDVPMEQSGEIGDLAADIARMAVRLEKSQEDLRASEASYRSLVELSPEAVLVWHDERVVFVNEAGAQLLGAGDSQAVAGRSLWDVVAPEYHAAVRERLARIAAGGGRVPLIEQVYVRLDGSRVPVEATGVGIEFRGRPAVLSVVRDISERKRLEESIRQSAERRMLAVEAAKMLPWEWDVASDTLTWSDAPDWLLGPLPPAGARHPDFRDLVRCEDRERYLAAGRAALAARGEYACEFRVVRTDGALRWVRAQGRVLADAAGAPVKMIGVTVDVTAGKQAEEAMRTLVRAVEQSPASILITDPEGNIEYVNPQLCELTGYAAEEVIGRNPRMFKSGRTAPEVYTELWRTIKSGGTWRGELCSRRKDGSLHWERTSISPVTGADGRILHFVGVKENITERRRADEEIRRLNAELEERVRRRTAQLEAANRELESFSYSVSHDLRAPLRAIDGFSHILAEEHAPALGPEGRRLLDRVSASALQMAALVDALLEFSRLGRKALAREGVDMTALAREVAAAAREASPGTAAEVGDLPPASGDRVLLRQVWQNLIGNAVKFSARAEKPAVAVGGRLEAGRASYYVRDNGEGFDMAYAGKLFRVFERLHSPRDYGGTGIGLATVKRIVERHGGEVRAESAPGRGATFWFSLPVSGKELDDCR